ncbi:hypothetical protein GCM10027168_10010 [Streptomyces capparidis]
MQEAERALGAALPSAMLDLVRVRNGGVVSAGLNTHPTDRSTSWSEDHVPFPDLMGIGRRERMTSLLDTTPLTWSKLDTELASAGGFPTFVAGLTACACDGDPDGDAWARC